MQKKGFTIAEIQQKMEHYCVYQDRCHKEVEQKLKDYYLIPEAKEQILLHLMQHDFLNESRFAKSFARGKFNQKGWGRIRITNELKLRDISSYNIKVALAEIDDADYIEKIYSLAQRRFDTYSDGDLRQHKKKLTDFLLRKGFEYALVNDAVNDVISQ